VTLDARPLWPGIGVEPVNHWGFLLGKLWGFAPTDRPVLLALRGVSVSAEETHEVVARPAYDDTGVLLVPGSEPFVFRLSTHPYQLRSTLSDDADGDGDGDVAIIRPGLYVLTLALTKPHPLWTMATFDGKARIPCARDLNHDGRISETEDAKALTASAILLHTGYDAPAGAEHRSSIGCQTAPLDVLQVIARAGKTIPYRLALASEALAALTDEDSGAHIPPEGIA